MTTFEARVDALGRKHKTCCPRTRIPEEERKQRYSDDLCLGKSGFFGGGCVVLFSAGRLRVGWVAAVCLEEQEVASRLQGCQISQRMIPWPEDPAFSVDPGPAASISIIPIRHAQISISSCPIFKPPSCNNGPLLSRLNSYSMRVSEKYFQWLIRNPPVNMPLWWHWSPRQQPSRLLAVLPQLWTRYHMDQRMLTCWTERVFRSSVP